MGDNKKSWFTVVMPNNLKTSPWDVEWNTKLRQKLVPVNKNLKKVRLHFPKFKFENEIDLAEFMSTENADSLFVGGSAGLTKMFQDHGVAESAYVDSFRQKAVIDCNQSGVKAAAVSVVKVSLLSMTPNYHLIEINKPFKFFIHNSRANKVYFQGVVQCPGSNC